MFDALNIFLNLLCVALVVVTGDNVGEEVVEDSLVIVALTADMETVVPVDISKSACLESIFRSIASAAISTSTEAASNLVFSSTEQVARAPLLL